MYLLKSSITIVIILCSVAIAYGLVNMLHPTSGGPPNFPFPFLPNEIIWFDHTYTVDYCELISCVYRDPSWLLWSLALYLGAAGLLALSLKSGAIIYRKNST